MKLSWFVSVILILLVGCVHVFNWAKYNYSDRDVLQAQVRHLTHELQASQLNELVLLDKFEGFQQEVAALMPGELERRGNQPEGFALRALASVTQSPRGSKGEGIRDTLGATLFEDAKKEFSKKNYKKANEMIRKFVNQSGYSTKAPEAYLLLAEGLYQESQFEEAAEVIRKMVDLFPGHEVTGFAMIRLGNIFEQRGRATDAIDVYKTVLKTFPQREVASQAMGSLKGVDF